MDLRFNFYFIVFLFWCSYLQKSHSKFVPVLPKPSSLVLDRPNSIRSFSDQTYGKLNCPSWLHFSTNSQPGGILPFFTSAAKVSSHYYLYSGASAGKQAYVVNTTVKGPTMDAASIDLINWDLTSYFNQSIQQNSTLSKLINLKPVIKITDKTYLKVAASAGNSIQFYESLDLLQWAHVTDFKSKDSSVVWNDASLTQVAYNNNGSSVLFWVLIVSASFTANKYGSSIEYFIGNFEVNTYTFRPLHTESHQFLDHGSNTFLSIDNKSKYVLWMNNNGKNGQLTWPRQLSLELIDWNLKLKSTLTTEVKEMLTKKLRIPSQHIQLASELIKIRPALAYELLNSTTSFKNPLLYVQLKFNLKYINWEEDAFSICFHNGTQLELCLTYEAKDNRIYLDTSRTNEEELLYGTSDQSDGKNSAATKLIFVERMTTSHILDFEIILDINSIEIFVDKGFSVLNAFYKSSVQFTMIDINFYSLELSSKLLLEEANVHGLKSIYNNNKC